MLTDEQKRLRKGRVTASVAPMILGLYPSKGPMDAFLAITGRDNFQGNERTEWGHRLEPQIIRNFVQEYQVEVSPGETCLHQDWAAATPDALVLSDSGDPVAVVECKAVGKRMIPHWSDSGVWRPPAYVEAQVRFQLYCLSQELGCDVNLGIVAVAFDDDDRWEDADHFDYRVAFFEVHRNLELEAQIVSLLRDWHARHILTDTPPPGRSDDEERISALIARKKLPSVPELLLVDEGSSVHADFIKLRDLTLERATLEAKLAILKTGLIRAVGGYSGLNVPGVGTFCAQKRVTVSWQKVAKKFNPAEQDVAPHRTESIVFVPKFEGVKDNEY